jgi:hypothetical protein
MKQAMLCALAGMVFAVLLALSAGCGATVTSVPYTEILESQNKIAATSPVFAYWQSQNPGQQWLSLARGDLNNDGRGDLVIVYGELGVKCYMEAVTNLPNGYRISAPVPAPVEDQIVSFVDMDQKPPSEFSVSGRKGDVVGSAIFRLENGTIKTLFDSAFGDCC